MAFVPFASWNSRSITHLANYLSRSLPMSSSDESPCQRPANQYAEQLRERRGPPKHAEIRVRRSFNGTESGTEFPGRCLYALCVAKPAWLWLRKIRHRDQGRRFLPPSWATKNRNERAAHSYVLFYNRACPSASPRGFWRSQPESGVYPPLGHKELTYEQDLRWSDRFLISCGLYIRRCKEGARTRGKLRKGHQGNLGRTG